MWQRYWVSFWEVTMCQWQKRFDPAYATYVQGLAAYDYASRAATTRVENELAAVATTGKTKRPLVTVAGTMDALLPIDRHARAYREAVQTSRRGDDRRRSQYRLWEVQNGNHIETYRQFYPQLEYIQPHAQRAFDLLVDHVEQGTALPPDQCIPRGGTIVAQPPQPGPCASLLVE
jgi:hypothetical protein